MQLGLGQREARLEAVGLLRGGLFEQRGRVPRVLLPHIEDAQVELGLVQAGLQLQGLAVFRDPLGVLVQKPIGQRQVEVGAVIAGVRLHGLGERLGGRVVPPLLQGLASLGREIRVLQKEQSGCRHPNPHHTSILMRGAKGGV